VCTNSWGRCLFVCIVVSEPIGLVGDFAFVFIDLAAVVFYKFGADRIVRIERWLVWTGKGSIYRARKDGRIQGETRAISSSSSSMS
jgi:hypothetical protein